MSAAFSGLAGSKKAIVTIVGAVLTYMAHAMGIDPTGELPQQIMTLAVTYVGGQSVVDGAARFKS